MVVVIQPGSPQAARVIVGIARIRVKRLARQLADDPARRVVDIGAPGGRLTELSAQFDAWVKSVEQMSGRIQGYKENPVIQQDLSNVPASIKRLEGQLAS
ncbi:MAG: hypothetical protein ABIV92_12705, partial [Thermoflexales bacterium]